MRSGAVVSQFWPDAPPTRYSFPMRNVVMSGMAVGTVVVEACATSGAKMQARLAMEHGKRLFLLERLVTEQKWAQRYAAKPGVTVVRDKLATVFRNFRHTSSPPPWSITATASVSLCGSTPANIATPSHETTRPRAGGAQRHRAFPLHAGACRSSLSAMIERPGGATQVRFVLREWGTGHGLASLTAHLSSSRGSSRTSARPELSRRLSPVRRLGGTRADV